MTAGKDSIRDIKWWWRAAGGATVLAVALAVLTFWLLREDVPVGVLTVGEKLVALQAERVSLQAKATGDARIGLLPAYRIGGLLSDALAARHERDHARAFEGLPALELGRFADLDALNQALKDALEKPGDGTRYAADQVVSRAQAALDRMAGADGLPLVLAYAPPYVPPRRAAGELTLAPGAPRATPSDGVLRLDAVRGPAGTPAASATVPTIPRYAPDFAASNEEDPALDVEIIGLNLGSGGGRPPVLTVGAWRGEARVTPQRLHFAVPRNAFATDATRTSFALGSLALRQGSRTMTFQLLFVVMPDRPGSFAFDQKVRATTLESNTLVSPEILVRAPPGETRTVRRCFDPPAGWRFDKDRMRIVVVERLGWLDDVADETLNAGTVEFVREDTPGQICLAVAARPASQAARTATIGRFEATLVRDVPIDRAVQSGVRALDWQEGVKVPIDPKMVEWKLYVRLFGEIDREFGGTADAGPIEATVPFLQVAIDKDGKTLILQAEPPRTP